MRDILSDLEAAEKADAADPMVSAQQSMEANLPKRFYKEVSVGDVEGEFGIFLDGRPVRTPAKAVLSVPTEALAELMAGEWRAQTERIDPRRMPATRLVNTAIDGVSREISAVVEDFLRFTLNDLLFYRASSPFELAERQREKWDPIVEIFEQRLGCQFELTEGVMYISQSEEATAALRSHVAPLSDPIEVACLHTFTTLTSSGLLALGISAGDITADQAWELAHLDEDWNIEHWGEDEEAIARRNGRWKEMKAAADVLAALRVG
jgi:chaperone required for assembly of F1-ATPase